MKKISKYILFSIIVFLLTISATFAKETDLNTLGKVVLKNHPKISSFYIIGQYVYTSDYVKDHSLNTQDIMLAARSIKSDGNDGELNTTPIYNKMNVYSAKGTKDITGKIKEWSYIDNLIGKTKLNVKDILDIKYIDYQPIEDIYKVTFKNETDGIIETKYFLKNEKIEAPSVEPKEGHEVKWLKAEEEFDLNNGVTEDTELKLKYEKIKLTVTFDKNNDTGSEEKKVDYGDNVTEIKPNPEKVGYTFNGWYQCIGENNSCTKLASEKFQFESTPIKQNITLQAKYDIIKLTVTFEMNEHGTQVDPQTIDYGNKAKRPPDPKDEAYAFKGWYQCTGEDNACTKLSPDPYNFETEITKNIKLQASWEEIKRTVKFKGIIDGVDDADNTIIKDKTSVELTYPFKLVKGQYPETPAGYKFIGWFKEDNSEITSITDFIFTKETTTIVGKWETERYTVTFKSDNDTVFKEVGNIKYNEKVDNPGTPEKEDNASEYQGYEFKDWYKCNGVDNSCDSHEAKPFNFQNTKITGNINVVAEFKPIVYTNKMVSDYVEALSKEYFDAYLVEDSKIKFDILENKGQTLLNKVEKTNAVLKFEEKLKVPNVENITITYGGEGSINLAQGADQATIKGELLKMLGSLVGGSLEDANLGQLDKKSFTVTINLKPNVTNIAGQNNDTYTVEFISDYEYVKDEAQLIAALPKGKPIILTDSFEVNKQIVIKQDTVIDGYGNKITSNINDKYLFDIKNENPEPQNNVVDLVLKDIKLEIDTLNVDEFSLNKDQISTTPNVNKNTVGVLVNKNTALTVTNVEVLNKTKITNNRNEGDFDEIGLVYKLDNKELHTYNVPFNENAAVELHGSLYGSGLTYENEFYNSPTVLVAKEASYNLSGLHINDNVELIYDDEIGHDKLTSDKFVQYYNDASKMNTINVWYVPNTRWFVPIRYFEEEHFIIPKAFQPNGKYYTYTDATSKDNYVFSGSFNYYDGGSVQTLSTDALQKKTVKRDYSNKAINAIYKKVD